MPSTPSTVTPFRQRIGAALPAAALCVGLAIGVPAAAHADDHCSIEYFVSTGGSDEAPGTSPAEAWQSLDRAVEEAYAPGAFGPGTCLWFEGGQTFEVGDRGQLYLDETRAGDADDRVVIGSFGTGRASLQAGEGNAILVYNTAGVTIQDLIIEGDGYTPGPPPSGNTGTGVFFLADTGGADKRSGVTLRDVEVSGFVNGVLIGGQNRSGFGDVLLESVSTHHNADAGFQTYGDSVITDTDYAHRDVVVRRMASFSNAGLPGKGNNSGNGIIFGDLDRGLIEQSVAYDNGALNDHPGGGPVGIWAYDSNAVVIQHNVSHDNKTSTIDGGGFDLDGGVTNSVLQYNYSYDNAGAGYLVFQYEGARPLVDNVVRYNISHDDGRAGQYGGVTVGSYGTPATDTLVYGNSIYMTPNGTGRPAGIRVWEGSENARFSNNSVHVTGGVPVASVEVNSTASFLGNNYFAEDGDLTVLVGGAQFDDAGATAYPSLEAWRAATGAESLDGRPVGSTTAPGYGDPAASSGDPEVFRITATSALNSTGLDLAALGIDAGGRDYFGVAVPREGRYSIGASQGPVPSDPGTPGIPSTPGGLNVLPATGPEDTGAALAVGAGSVLMGLALMARRRRRGPAAAAAETFSGAGNLRRRDRKR